MDGLVRPTALEGRSQVKIYGVAGELVQSQYHLLWPNMTININPGFPNLSYGEWRRASQPCALAEPCVNLSIHPAHPAVGPKPQWANRSGLRRRSERKQFQHAILRPRNRLYLRCNHRTRNASIVRSCSRSLEG